MAVVTEVRLDVSEQSDSHGRWSLSVSYSVTFELWEREVWFQERAEFIGIGADGETVLATLTGPPFRPAPDVSDQRAVRLERRSPVVALSAETLDVNPDVEIDMGSLLLGLHEVDRVRAKVTVTPLTASAGEGWSAIEARQFGATV